MVGAGTALAHKYILPRVLRIMAVSRQDFSILFDVVFGAQDPHRFHACLFVMVYRCDFKISIPVGVAAGVIGKLTYSFN